MVMRNDQVWCADRYHFHCFLIFFTRCASQITNDYSYQFVFVEDDR